jgi:hypothetical protein
MCRKSFSNSSIHWVEKLQEELLLLNRVETETNFGYAWPYEADLKVKVQIWLSDYTVMPSLKLCCDSSIGYLRTPCEGANRRGGKEKKDWREWHKAPIRQGSHKLTMTNCCVQLTTFNSLTICHACIMVSIIFIEPCHKACYLPD